MATVDGASSRGRSLGLRWLLCLFLISIGPVARASSVLRLSRISGVTYTNGRLGAAFVSDAGAVPMHDRMDSTYLAEVEIGNQTFQVTLDTGSSDLWVVSSDCADDDCKQVDRYEPSSSLVKSDQRFKLDYLSGGVEGNIAHEIVRLGQYRIYNQTVALANHTENLNLANAGYSGIMGLAFPAEASIAASAGQTLLSNVLSALPAERRFFALRLHAHDAISSLTIGALDPATGAALADFTRAPVVARPGGAYDFWKLPLSALSVDGAALALGPSKVPGAHVPIGVLDSGTTLMLGPSADVSRLWAALSVDAHQADGRWLVRCTRALNVSFTLGGVVLPLDPSDVVWAGAGTTDGWCLAGIQANDDVNSGDWLLGDAFLRNVHVTHHLGEPPQLGLLSTTNASAALVAFRAARGEDASLPVASIRPLAAIASADEHHSTPIYVASLLGGFLVGAFFMFFGVRKRRRLL